MICGISQTYVDSTFLKDGIYGMSILWIYILESTEIHLSNV